MITIRRVLLQEKDEGGNIFKQIKFFHKEAGINIRKAIALAWSISFQGKTVLLQLEPGGNPVNFDEMVTKAHKVFNARFELLQRNYMGLFIDRSIFELVREYNKKDLAVFISYYKGVS